MSENNVTSPVHRPVSAGQLSPNCRTMSENNVFSPVHRPVTAGQLSPNFRQTLAFHRGFCNLCVATLALTASAHSTGLTDQRQGEGKWF